MGIFSRIAERIAKWYRGPFIAHDSPVFTSGHHEPPLLARILRAVAREWKWLIGTAVAIVAIVVKLHG